MARYLFRLSILGPSVLDAARIASIVGPAFSRLGFSAEPVTITSVKSVAPPTMIEIEGAPTFAAQVPPWGQVLLDNTAAARGVRALTQASIVIHGTLPPDTASGRSGGAQVSNAVFAAVNAGLGAGWYNLTGAGREAGLVVPGSSSAALVALGLTAAAVVWYSRRAPGSARALLGLSTRTYRATKMRKLAQRYRHAGRFSAAKKLEKRANSLSR